MKMISVMIVLGMMVLGGCINVHVPNYKVSPAGIETETDESDDGKESSMRSAPSDLPETAPPSASHCDDDAQGVLSAEISPRGGHCPGRLNPRHASAG